MPVRFSGTCQFCKSDYSNTTSRIFCSGACYHASRGAATIRTCELCGSTFKKCKQGHHGDPRFCSNKCQGASKKTLVTHACELCGELFQRKASYRNRARFCSKSCTFKAMEDSLGVACELCGAQFTVSRNREATARFCSRRCKAHFKGESYLEKLLRLALDELGITYQQEHKAHPYSIDFFLPEWQIALEADGGYWHQGREAHDAKRNAFLLARGIVTVRLTGSEICAAPHLPSFVVARLSVALGRLPL